jgi:hypothetical protein
VSRRRRREERPARPPTAEPPPPPPPRRPRMSLAAQLGILVAVFAVAVLIAELAGAANLGIAFGIGQIAFALAALWLIVWR